MASCIFPVAVVALLLGAAHGLAVKCKCDCQGTELTCGKDLKTNALQTFKNPCQMICQNCVSSEITRKGIRGILFRNPPHRFIRSVRSIFVDYKSIKESMPQAISHRECPVSAIADTAAREKHRKYDEAAEDHRGSFSPLICSCEGVLNKEFNQFLRRLASTLAEKWAKQVASGRMGQDKEWILVKSGECDKVSRAKRRLPPPSPPPSSSPGTTTPPTLSKIITASKQSAATPQKPTPAPVPPPKALASIMAKAVPSPPKSPNTPPLPHHSQQQSMKVQAIGG